MPELPEVETVRLSLQPVIQGRVISSADIYTPQVWLSGGLPATGWQIAAVGRRGKYLLFRLIRADISVNGLTGQSVAAGKALLIVHLRMTGQLLLQTADQPPVLHDHIRLRLEMPPAADQAAAPPIWLVYHDTRRFGRCWLLPDDRQDQMLQWPAGLQNLGPEPLEPAFGAQLLASRLARRARTNLKAALLDQTVVAGLGNIYADEVLFASGLHPALPAGSLDEPANARLAAAIVEVLHRAIDCQGTTLRDYVNGWNQKGTFQSCLMVYGRAGQPCRQCGSLIEHGRLAGRSTCWCPVCQPEVLKSQEV